MPEAAARSAGPQRPPLEGWFLFAAGSPPAARFTAPIAVMLSSSFSSSFWFSFWFSFYLHSPQLAALCLAPASACQPPAWGDLLPSGVRWPIFRDCHSFPAPGRLPEYPVSVGPPAGNPIRGDRRPRGQPPPVQSHPNEMHCHGDVPQGSAPQHRIGNNRLRAM